MKANLILVALCALLAAGCNNSDTGATESDKANIERLHEEGIGKVMSGDAKDGANKPDVSLANPTGKPGPEALGP